MTKEGKCDTCRERKVKCDEKRPVCGSCKKKSRSCTYNYGKTVRFAHGGYGGHSTPKDAYESILEASGPLSSIEGDTQCQVTDTHVKKSTKRVAAFRLRSIRAAKSGEGTFQTLVPVRSRGVEPTPRSSESLAKAVPSGCFSKMAPSRDEVSENLTSDTLDSYGSFRGPPLALLKSPSNATTRLIKRFVSLTECLGQGFDTPFVMVEFHSLLPHRIGQNSVMDLALNCLIDSTVFHVNRTAENLSILHESNAKALSGLRKSMLNAGPEFLSDHLLLTVPMLQMTEIFALCNTSTISWHQQGLLDLLQSMSKNGMQYNEVIQTLFYYCLKWEFINATGQGRDSIFDTPAWLSIPAPRSSLGNTNVYLIHEYTRDCWVKIPRLARLLRQARQSPENLAVRNEAIDLAIALYANDLDFIIDDLIANDVIKTVPTSTEEHREGVKQSFHFASVEWYNRCLNYWAVRILICGIVLSLPNMFPDVSSFDMLAAASQDVHAATCLAMSVQYSLSDPTSLPIHGIRLFSMLQISFGAWYRLERRDLWGLGDKRPRCMMEWCIKIIHSIQKRLLLPLVPFEDMLRRYEWTLRSR